MALIYLDDVVVYCSTLNQHLERLSLELAAFGRANLRLNPEILVHLVSKQGI